MPKSILFRAADGARHRLVSIRRTAMIGCSIFSTPVAAEPWREIDFSLDGMKAPASTSKPEFNAPLMQEAALSIEPDPLDRTSGTHGPLEANNSITADSDRLSFQQHVASIKWEIGAVLAYMTAINLVKIADKGAANFSFQNEGLFERDTINLGIDKLSHAHNSYVLSELIAARIRKKTSTARGTAVSGALLASGIMVYSELFDGFKTTSGFGAHDVLFNTLGAGFSVLRNTTPGLEDKLDFRVLVVPNRNVYTYTGREHYRQLRYLFALELQGFDRLRRSPLRFVELHAGYYGKGFTDREIARGAPRERKLFVGVGVNLNNLLFGRAPTTRGSRAASQVLDYWQPPYTYLHWD